MMTYVIVHGSRARYPTSRISGRASACMRRISCHAAGRDAITIGDGCADSRTDSSFLDVRTTAPGLPANENHHTNAGKEAQQIIERSHASPESLGVDRSRSIPPRHHVPNGCDAPVDPRRLQEPEGHLGRGTGRPPLWDSLHFGRGGRPEGSEERAQEARDQITTSIRELAEVPADPQLARMLEQIRRFL